MRKILFVLPFVLLTVNQLCFCAESLPSRQQLESRSRVKVNTQVNYSQAFVKRVVDGDTLLLSTGEYLRLIGIDTPEVHQSNKLLADSKRSGQDVQVIQKMGARASGFVKNLVEAKSVRLEFDAEKHDRYGRLLAYVYLEDGTFVNAEIVKQGYASIMTYPPNVKYADLFLQLSRQARQEKKGLWKD